MGSGEGECREERKEGEEGNCLELPGLNNINYLSPNIPCISVLTKLFSYDLQ